MTEKKSFMEIQRDAALERVREWAAEERRVTDIVLGAHSPSYRRVGQVVKLGSDYLVEVVDGKDASWTTVVGGERSIWHFYTQDMALLHLLARRHDGNDSDGDAALYAGRVLGVTDEPPGERP